MGYRGAHLRRFALGSKGGRRDVDCREVTGCGVRGVLVDAFAELFVERHDFVELRL